LPESSDLFTHRVGRTGRMGRQGKAITLLVPSDVPKWRRMAHNLGQVVALQRLVVDEEALVAPPLASPEAASMQEYEQNGKPRLGRTTGKHETPALAATAPQSRTAKRKPSPTPLARTRRSAVSTRSTSRSRFSKKA